MRDVVAGIFVGGRGERLGGAAKGLLATQEGTTIVARLAALLDEVGVPYVLVGRRPEYAALGLATLDDDPPGVGPIGGLAALLAHAGDRHALALACDMPYVTARLLRRLIDGPEATVLAPRRNGRWEPLVARYDAARVLPIVRRRVASGRTALQGVLEEAGAVELAVEAGEVGELRDWDTDEDVRNG